MFLSLQCLTFLRCIDEISAVVATFLQDCHEATGFAWQLVGGGLNQSGEIKVVMYVMLCLSFFRYWFFYVGNRCSAGKQQMDESSRTPTQIGSLA